MKKAIYFDMDGTLVDFYGVDGWLNDLKHSHTRPYDIGAPLVNMNVLARYLNKLQKKGYHIGVISWGANKSSKSFLDRTRKAKRNWLHKHLKSVKFDEIRITQYGKAKHKAVKYPNGILFDDNPTVREKWTGTALDVDNILSNLRALLYEDTD